MPRNKQTLRNSLTLLFKSIKDIEIVLGHSLGEPTKDVHFVSILNKNGSKPTYIRWYDTSNHG